MSKYTLYHLIGNSKTAYSLKNPAQFNHEEHAKSFLESRLKRPLGSTIVNLTNGKNGPIVMLFERAASPSSAPSSPQQKTSHPLHFEIISLRRHADESPDFSDPQRKAAYSCTTKICKVLARKFIRGESSYNDYWVKASFRGEVVGTANVDIVYVDAKPYALEVTVLCTQKYGEEEEFKSHTKADLERLAAIYGGQPIGTRRELYRWLMLHATQKLVAMRVGTAIMQVVDYMTRANGASEVLVSSLPSAFKFYWKQGFRFETGDPYKDGGLRALALSFFSEYDHRALQLPEQYASGKALVHALILCGLCVKQPRDLAAIDYLDVGLNGYRMVKHLRAPAKWSPQPNPPPPRSPSSSGAAI